jgi:putative aldouronate transport system substrate-binding protein
MRNRQMKVGWVLLSFVLCMTLVLSGCSKEGGSSGGEKATAPTNTITPDNKAAVPEKKLTLNWFIFAPANTNLPSADKDFVKKFIEQKFNVDIKVDYMAAGTEYLNKVKVLLASTPPDMITLLDGRDPIVETGLIGNMRQYINANKMPNYFRWLDEAKILNYGQQQMSESYYTAPMPYSPLPYRSYYIRKDWLDKLGLKIPQSYDEYVKVLKAFRNDDPDGNGKKDTYGFSTAAAGAGIGTEWPEFQKNGLVFPRQIENNKYVDMQLDPRDQGVLEDIIKLINDDVVDPDWFLNKSPQHLEKAIQGKVGVVLSTDPFVAYDSNLQGLQKRTKQLFPNANWVPFTMFPGKPLSTEAGPGNRGPWLFPKKTIDNSPEKVERSNQILEWMTGEEGYLLTHYGIEGKHYTRNGKTIKQNVDAYDADITKQGDFLRIWSFFTPDKPSQFGLTVDNPRVTGHDREIEKFLETLPYIDDVGTSLKPPAGTDNTAMRNKQKEYMAKAIFEDKSGKNWPQYYQDVMKTYMADKIFAAYEEQIKKVGKIK